MTIYRSDVIHLPLEQIGPKPGATGGQPVESAVELYDDGKVQIGIWECTPGEFPSDKSGISEYMCFVSGDATIIGEDGTKHDIGPGSAILLPDGWRGRWEIRETVCKTYTIIVSSP